MRRILLLLALFIGASSLTLGYLSLNNLPPFAKQYVLPEYEKEIILTDEEKSEITINQPSDYHLLPASQHVYQTFNNCGPATLTMVLSWYGTKKTQRELGELMRPYQNPKGDNDDKTIFPAEFTEYARKFEFSSINRPNGTIEQIKFFVENDIPVVVKTWLRPNEDIGHFRIVRGFDNNKKVVIQDDSYHGQNKKIAYDKFLAMWQPFNYGYMLVYPKEKEKVISAILGEEKDGQVAWQNAAERAEREIDFDPENIYSWFNLSVALYHLGDYEKSVNAYEKVEDKLPRRMLWYQIEPILAYQKLGRHERVFQITDNIISSGNRAFSELYQIRGEIYLEKGDKDSARKEFELAILYNENFEPAKLTLKNL